MTWNNVIPHVLWSKITRPRVLTWLSFVWKPLLYSFEQNSGASLERMGLLSKAKRFSTYNHNDKLNMEKLRKCKGNSTQFCNTELFRVVDHKELTTTKKKHTRDVELHIKNHPDQKRLWGFYPLITNTYGRPAQSILTPLKWVHLVAEKQKE